MSTNFPDFKNKSSYIQYIDKYGTSSRIFNGFAIPIFGRSQAHTAAKGRFILDVLPRVAEFLGVLGAKRCRRLVVSWLQIHGEPGGLDVQNPKSGISKTEIA